MPKYNHRYEDFDGDLYEIWTNKYGTETSMRRVDLEDEDDDYEDFGCVACGNPAYPNCKASGPMFDD